MSCKLGPFGRNTVPIIPVIFAVVISSCASHPHPAPRADNEGQSQKRSGQHIQSDPLAHLKSRYNTVHYMVAQGQGADGAKASDNAKAALLAQIQSRLHAVTVAFEGCDGDDCDGEEAHGVAQRLVKEIPPFKHGALIQATDPIKSQDGFVALAILRRDQVTPLMQRDIDTMRERLEGWRSQMRGALSQKDALGLLRLCGGLPEDTLGELEELRLALAVVANDAQEYTPSDDLRSVVNLQREAQKTIGSVRASLVLVEDGGHPEQARQVVKWVQRMSVAKGLHIHPPGEGTVSGQSPVGITIQITPRFQSSQDTFHFFRSGVILDGHITGTNESLFKIDIDRENTRGGGVQPQHAIKESMAKLRPLLEGELDQALPDSACSL